MIKESVRSPHAKCATAILRLANPGQRDETPMRRIIDCYKTGKGIEPCDLRLLADLCDTLHLPLAKMLAPAGDAGRDFVRAFNPDSAARESLGMMPLEHWHH